MGKFKFKFQSRSSCGKLGFLLASSSLLAVTVAEASAQDGAQQASGASDVMIVTAQRREQSLAEVPASVTAFGEQAIESYQIDDVSDYAALAPNVGFSSGGSPIELDLAFRGVSNLGGAVNSVAIYLDQFNLTPAPNPTTFDPNLLDVERIEILRGPQGTLFGRNVLGGGVNIVTNKPGGEFEARLDLEYGRFDQRLVRGIVNIPLGETLAMRAVGYYEANDGFLQNLGSSGDTNDSESFGGRVAFRWTPNDQLIADVAVSYSDYQQGLLSSVPTGVPRPFFTQAGFPVDPFGEFSEVGFYPENTRFVSTGFPSQFDNETFLVTGEVSYDFDGVSLIVNGGYIDNQAADAVDSDHVNAEFFSDPGQAAELDSKSVEARLQSNGDGPVTWVLGGLYADDSRNILSSRRELGADFVGAFSLPAFLIGAPVVDEAQTIDIRSLAVFGDVSWAVPNTRLTLGAGMRYSNDRVREGIVENPVVLLGVGGFTEFRELSAEETFDLFTAKISALYDLTDNVNAYASASRGTKPGGANLALFGTDLAALSIYDPEVIWNYEIGAKGVFFDGNLMVNATGFYSDWSDLQIESGFFEDVITNFTNLTANAGDAESIGFELDFVARLGEFLTLNGGVGFNDASVGDGVLTTNDQAQLVDVSGNTLPFASRWNANIAGQYDHPIGNELTAFIRTEFSYRSSFFESLENVDAAFDRVDAYNTLNVRVGIEGDNWRFVAFGENLADPNHSLGLRSLGDVGISGALVTVVPRTWGVRLSLFTN